MERAMEYIAGNTDFSFKNTAVTLGKFDGIHLGHQFLMNQAISYKKQGLTAVVFSFLMHPGSFFSDKEFQLIYTEEEKVAKLSRMGIDVLISYPFTEKTKSMEPEDFIKEVLVERLDVKVIVVGDDFRFGSRRRGDVELLKRYEDTYGYKVIACEKKKWNNEIISSTTIRKALKEGDLDTVNSMLGQPYFIRGEVVHGRQLGRTLGFPTTNIKPSSAKLLPPCGVYATKTLINGKLHLGVTNVGYKPTVGADEYIGIETYLLDYDKDLYGDMVGVEFYSYLRPELTFDSVEDLINKMKEDVIVAQNYFKGKE